MAISTAVGLDRRSTIIGFGIGAGNFAASTPNLPISILVLGQANTDKVSGLNLNKIEQHLTAKEVGDIYGYGSPLHRAMRILKPIGSDGVGGIPVFFAAQSDSALTATVKEITVTGTVTKNADIVVSVGGRTLLDGSSLIVSVLIGDTADVVMGKIRDAVNNCVSCEYLATFVTMDTEVVLTSKFKGVNSLVRLDVSISIIGSGLTIATTETPGTGSASVTPALNEIGDKWIPMVVNTYSVASSSILDEIQAFNGMPGVTPTGRYSGIIMKPFVCLTGITSSTDFSSAVTYGSTNIDQVTHSFAPAPASAGSCYEASAWVALRESVLANNDPSKDVINMNMDMPAPYDISFSQPSYDQRDLWCRAGVSTSLWDDTISKYVIKDLITTYRVDTEAEPSFRWVRDVYIDFNMKFKYYLMQENSVIGKVIIPDTAAVPSNISSNIISPKVFRALVLDLIDEMASDGLITDRDFSKSTLFIEIDATNPNRFNCEFSYKRTGIARITSTNVLAGHFFGN